MMPLQIVRKEFLFYKYAPTVKLWVDIIVKDDLFDWYKLFLLFIFSLLPGKWLKTTKLFKSISAFVQTIFEWAQIHSHKYVKNFCYNLFTLPTKLDINISRQFQRKVNATQTRTHQINICLCYQLILSYLPIGWFQSTRSISAYICASLIFYIQSMPKSHLCYSYFCITWTVTVYRAKIYGNYLQIFVDLNCKELLLIVPICQYLVSNVFDWILVELVDVLAITY